ncbi:MAG: Xaa-Pro peptidase family protein [Synergistaceae bacterium]|jgi:Xaa-Pro aminopeptidase|nr:Xaa-Pro peptidase family protein [Synergistaceae bacterium]
MKYSDRIAGVQAGMKRTGLDAVFLTPSTNLFYVAGIGGRMMERLSCCVILSNSVHFVAPAFELGNLGEESRSLVECHGWSDGSGDPFEIVGRLLKGSRVKRAAIDRHAPSWVLTGLQKLIGESGWELADVLLDEMRIIKDEDEYRLIKAVQEKSCSAILRLIEHGIRGLTEREAARLLTGYSAERGVNEPSPIVASGPNSALPHHSAGDRIIQEGDPVVFDFGGKDEETGYIADTTRTFVVGRIPDGFKEIYDTVLRANQAAFDAIKPGLPCEDVDKAGRNVIEAAGYGEYFTHRIGHGLGLDVHEAPYITSGNKTPLRPGNCFSDEPGIYLPGKFGVRIEDAIFIRQSGPERLTPLDHDLHVVN